VIDTPVVPRVHVLEARPSVAQGRVRGGVCRRNLGSLEDSRKVIDQTMERFRRVDILVNNATRGSGEVRIQIAASGINPHDVRRRQNGFGSLLGWLRTLAVSTCRRRALPTFCQGGQQRADALPMS
jgi:NAD(P)-dependent dehydrogenase (short-subunit alcohol dehydrogenase family)